LLAGILLFAACTGDGGGPDGDVDVPTGKADSIFGFEEGSSEALAILRVANTVDEGTLDEDVGLDSRAAQGIVARRPDPGGYPNLAALVEVPFVKQAALEAMFEFAADNDLVGRSLSIATFNIRWFGLGGSLFGSFGSETRVDTIRAFLDDNLLDHDVLVFEEIVDVELFMDEVVADRTCITYEGFSGKHQHVVLCHRDGLTLEPVEGDDDFAFEALNLSNLRPGLQGRLVDDDGSPLANIIGVHLKAREDSTEVRLEQAAVLADHVAELREVSPLPVIVIGDFNTHQARDTGLPEDDEVLIDEVLEPRIRRVVLPVDNTYRHRNGQDFRLDQAYVTSEVEVEAVDVPGPCNLDFATGADAIDEYFSDVSDHCPVRLQLRLP
jgi:hypothetical protein